MGQVCSNLTRITDCDPAILDIPVYFLVTVLLCLVLYVAKKIVDHRCISNLRGIAGVN